MTGLARLKSSLMRGCCFNAHPSFYTHFLMEPWMPRWRFELPPFMGKRRK